MDEKTAEQQLSPAMNMVVLGRVSSGKGPGQGPKRQFPRLHGSLTCAPLAIFLHRELLLPRTSLADVPETPIAYAVILFDRGEVGPRRVIRSRSF